MSERKAPLGNGILMGMGMMLIISGFFGWFTNNYLLGILTRVFEESGIDTNHFIMKDLTNLMLDYVLIIVVGFVSLFLGVVMHVYNLRLQGRKGSVVAVGIVVFLLGLQLGIQTPDGNTLPYALFASVAGIILIIWGITSRKEDQQAQAR